MNFRLTTGLFAALLLALSSLARATMIETFPVALGARDKSLVARAACPNDPSQAYESLVAYRYDDQPHSPIQVDVICKPHRQLPEGVVRTRVSCESRAGRWDCRSEGEYLEVRAEGRLAHVGLGSVTDTSAAAGIIAYLFTLSNYDGTNVAGEIDGQTCFVRRVPTGEWEVSCDGLYMSIEKDCIRGVCSFRLFGPIRRLVP